MAGAASIMAVRKRLTSEARACGSPRKPLGDRREVADVAEHHGHGLELAAEPQPPGRRLRMC